MSSGLLKRVRRVCSELAGCHGQASWLARVFASDYGLKTRASPGAPGPMPPSTQSVHGVEWHPTQLYEVDLDHGGVDRELHNDLDDDETVQTEILDRLRSRLHR